MVAHKMKGIFAMKGLFATLYNFSTINEQIKKLHNAPMLLKS